jgi:ECF transporter S component (folate family)
MRELVNIKKIAYVGLLIALEIILTRFLSFENQFIRIGFGFIPVSMIAILFGPLTGGLAAAIADVAGMMIWPKAFFFPGFTFSAFLTGVIYGLFLYKKRISLGRVTAAVTFITAIVDITLNTIWLTILTGKTASYFLGARIIKSTIMYPIMVFLILIVWKSVGVQIAKRTSN